MSYNLRKEDGQFSDEVKGRIRECVAGILARSQGKWVPVSEYAFGDLAKGLGIDRRFVGYVTTALKELNDLETSGLRAGMRFRTLQAWVDVDKVVEMVEFSHELYLENLRAEKLKKNSKDYQPLFVKENKEKIDTPTVIIPSTKFHAMDSRVFLMLENRIVEGKVVGIAFLNEGYGHQLSFDANIKPEPEEKIDYYLFGKLFTSIQALTINLEKNMCRYKTKSLISK